MVNNIILIKEAIGLATPPSKAREKKLQNDFSAVLGHLPINSIAELASISSRFTPKAKKELWVCIFI